MAELGERLTELGLYILPYSFWMYFPVRWFEYRMGWGYTRLVKAAWYLALGLFYVTSDQRAEVVVMYICFIEAWDLWFDHREGRNGLRREREPRLEEGRISEGSSSSPTA